MKLVQPKDVDLDLNETKKEFSILEDDFNHFMRMKVNSEIDTTESFMSHFIRKSSLIY